MSGWEGKTRGGVSGYAIFVFLVSFLPLRAVYLVLNFVVLYFFFFSPNAFKSIYDFYYRRKKFGRIKSLRYVWRNYYLLGQSYYRDDQLERADHYLRQALKLAPKNPRYLDTMLAVSIMRKDRVTAVIMLDTLTAVDPNNGNLSNYLEQIKQL